MSRDSQQKVDRKILDLDDLSQRIRKIQAAGQTVALCHGVFDLLHIGHLRYLQGAGRKADVVVVTVTPDRFVDKGPHRPAFTESLRLEALASLESVDYVATNRWPTAEDTLRLLRPNVYVKGAEFQNEGDDPTGKMELERSIAKELGCRVEFVDDLVFSSSQLLNRHFDLYPDPVRDFLAELRNRRQPLEEVFSLLDRIAQLRVLVVGDIPVERIVRVEALDKTDRASTPEARYLSEESRPAGASNIANHVAALGCQVNLLSLVGDFDSASSVKHHLAAGVRTTLVQRSQPNAVSQSRFVDARSGQTLFELQHQKPDLPLPAATASLLRKFNGLIGYGEEGPPPFDLVLCVDHGQGTVPAELAQALGALPCFLALSVRDSSRSQGFDSLSQHTRADFVCLSESEVSLRERVGSKQTSRKQSAKLNPLLSELVRPLGGSLAAVSRGMEGCWIQTISSPEQDENIVEAPALSAPLSAPSGASLSEKANRELQVDENAFFAVASLAAAVGAVPEWIALLGSAAPTALDSGQFRKHLTALLK